MPEGCCRSDLLDRSQEHLLERQGEACKIGQTDSGGAVRARFIEESGTDNQGSRPALSG